MQSVAQAWLVYSITKSSFLLGAVGFASQIPVFLLAPLGRHRRRPHQPPAAHHRDAEPHPWCWRRSWPGSLSAGASRSWHIFILATLLGVVNAFDIPGRQSFLVDMVGKEDLMNAIALNSSMFNGARVVGPGGGRNSADQVRRGLVLRRERRQLHRGDRRSADDERALRPACRPEFTDRRTSSRAFAGSMRHKVIRALLLLIGLVSLVGMPYTVLMPVFADQILHGGARGLGISDGRHRRWRPARRADPGLEDRRQRARAAGSRITCAGFRRQHLPVFVFPHTSGSRRCCCCPPATRMMLQMACSNTLIQTMVPDQLRGRVMALYSMMFMGMAPFGALFGGALAQRAGAPSHGCSWRSCLHARRDLVRT